MGLIPLVVVIILAALGLWAIQSIFPEMDAQLKQILRVVIIIVVVVCVLIWLAGVFGIAVPLHIRLN